MSIGARMASRIRPADRVVVGIIGVFNLFVAWRLLDIPDSDRLPWASAWPLLFLAAGVACIALELRFLNRDLLALAGALSATAYASRAAVLVVGMERGVLELGDQRAHLAIAQWLAITALVGYIFVRVLRPLLELRRLAT